MISEKVRHFIETRSLLRPGDRVLVAFSGGPDSACLLILLREIWNDTAAVYVNHHLRGEESNQEEQFVRRFCSAHGIPLFVEEIRWKKKPSNLEEAARKRRYRHLAKVAAEQAFDKVALAHQKEDVAETFLLRLIRGTGPQGLSGIAPSRGIYIRPLLECSREEILQFLSERKISYFVDSTNRELRFQRNRIRNEFIPYIKQHFNPRVLEALFRTSRWIEEQNELVLQLLVPFQDLIQEENQTIRLDREKFLQLTIPLRKAVLQLAIKRADPSLQMQSRSFQRLLNSIEREEDSELPGFLKVEQKANLIQFVRKTRSGLVELDITQEGEYFFPPANVYLKFTAHENPTFVAAKDVAFLDADRASFPLYVRNPKRGDSFQPLGLSGHKKLSDFFIDHKIPRSERKNIPLVFKDDDLVWVAGHQINHDYRVTENTRKVLRIELRKNV